MSKCRCKKCVSFRKEYPFEYLDIFGFYSHLSDYLYPRLEAFRDNTFSYPMGLTLKKWKVIINKMIFSFKNISNDKITTNKKEQKRIREGLDLFSEYFHDLWM